MEKTQLRKADKLYAEWLYKMHYEMDCAISQSQYELMVLCGLVTTNEQLKPTVTVRQKEGYGKHKRNWKISHPVEQEATPLIEITEAGDSIEDIEAIIKYAENNITNKDWLPESRTNHTLRVC